MWFSLYLYKSKIDKGYGFVPDSKKMMRIDPPENLPRYL